VGAVSASPFFAQQTGKDCVACHQPGREADGKAGLNPMGQAFLQCGFKFDCSTPPVTPPKPITPVLRPVSPVVPSPVGPLKAATFRDDCASDDSYFMINTGVSRPSRMSFVIKNRHHVTLLLPPGATFAMACGRAPFGLEKRPVRFD